MKIIIHHQFGYRDFNCVVNKQTILIFILLIAVTFYRFYLGRSLGVWIPLAEFYDDSLMVYYSDLKGHFLHSTPGVNYPNELLKNMGYPVLLWVFQKFNITYTDGIVFLWIFAAISVSTLIYELSGSQSKITKSKLFYVGIYTFVLYTPIAFDLWGGTRLYRNAALTPLYFIVIAISLYVFLKCFSINFLSRRFYIIQFVLGFVFSLTYYVKEDGDWLLLCYLIVFLCSAVICLYRFFKLGGGLKFDLVKIIVGLSIPLVVFSVITLGYKALNHYYFGIWDINSRTASESGRFVRNIYRIQTPDSDWRVWAPASALEKAFTHSSTLNKNRLLKESIFRTPWCLGDIYKYPILADFLTWILKDASATVFSNYKDQELFFRQVNCELEEALSNGKIRENNKLFLSSSMGGRDSAELARLPRRLTTMIRQFLFLEDYIPGYTVRSFENIMEYANSYPWLVRKTLKLCDMNVSYTKQQQDYFNEVPSSKNKKINRIFCFYKFLNPILMIMSFLSLSILIFVFLKRLTHLHFKIIVNALLQISLMGVGLVYGTAVVWFSEFLDPPLWIKFYSLGSIPLFTISGLLGLLLLIELSPNLCQLTRRLYRCPEV